MKRLKTSADDISGLCWNLYNDLSKTGKPIIDKEWTILSAIILNYDNGTKEVIALSTGTKCVMKNKDNKNVIIDCHSESLLKRCFKRHLISRIANNMRMDNWSVTMFVSQLPCGAVQRWKGADNDNPLLSYDKIGVHRKPGRGKLCPKPCCISKIAKWNMLGFQGKLLTDYIKKPIYIDTFVIGNCGADNEYDEEMLKKLIKCDTENVPIDCDLFILNRIPEFLFSKDFRKECFVKTDAKRAAPSAIVTWKNGKGQFVTEIVTEGQRHGVTKKNANNCLLLVSDVLINKDINLLPKDGEILSEKYEKLWNELKKSNIFKEWDFLDNSDESHCLKAIDVPK